jgi:S-adenosylmethionine:tRNA ribosyltransferase-isomerase
MDIKNIKIEDYNYDLPDARIANFPLQERDASKLLIYNGQHLQEDHYRNIAQYIPEHSLLVFNNTKVIHARILFTKATGGIIEIFILKPYATDIVSGMQNKDGIQVECFIGGASKWKPNTILQKKIPYKGLELTLEANFISKLEDGFVIALNWNGEVDFATILELAGNVPLPPYIKRTTEAIDEERYQTIYAEQQGSVAAPTAGLHFTDAIFNSFAPKAITKGFVTLHVSAGTFKPVTAAAMQEHIMHEEYITVASAFLKKLLVSQSILAVGTTSLRTLETLYWLGVKVLQNESISKNAFVLKQWDAYELPTLYSVAQSIEALLQWMQKQEIELLTTTTQLLIGPGYNFKIAKGLITNFHQPKSTLLLLVAAATNGNWRMLYNHALANDYRFLSYGDGCLLLW